MPRSVRNVKIMQIGTTHQPKSHTPTSLWHFHTWGIDILGPLVDGHLFQHGYTHPLITCVSGNQIERILSILHEGICGSHIDGRALSLKIIRAGYYWPRIKEDNMMYVKKCEQCQNHADCHHAPAEESHSN